ncbi:MAG: XrtA-associated tyrosine autokinase [Burkholderiaceae bacterium]
MTSLIEQAARRLEQLRRAGAVVPESLSAGKSPSVAEALTVKPVRKPVETRAESSVVQTSKQVTLDLAALSAAGIVTPNSPRSHLADQFRLIKRPLLANVKAQEAGELKHGNLIMVTSSLAGEGKSFSSVNLAMSLAMELDNTVMLVDADVARPSVLRMLGIPPGPGLLDLLEGKVDMQSVLLKTNIDKLTILPSGTPHPKATELLASDAMRALLDDMAQRYPDRIIIFDSPPLLLTTEARVLATQMGQVLLVVQAERTLQSDVQHALSTIKTCSNISLVLNKVRGVADSGYGYGYGYGYGTPSDKPTA